jgi:hypothetical protein
MNDAEAMIRQFRNSPRNDGIADRKERFAALNAFVTGRDGFVTSVSGAPEVTIECLPGSVLPDALRALGHDVAEAGEGERILHSAIIERFTRRADGDLELLTPGSTAAVAEVRNYAGIVRVRRYVFAMP